MFTGIIEHIGIINAISKSETNVHFTIETALSVDLKVDESIAHEGVCLTITEIIGDSKYKVTAIAETLAKTTIGNWQIGKAVNLERAMIFGARLDGHFVQGHVDATVQCTEVQTQDGSWLYTFEVSNAHAPLLVEKGSVCVNGTSLTCFNVTKNSFTVAIIPYTYQNTTINEVQVGQMVNIEFDVVGKYILRNALLQN